MNIGIDFVKLRSIIAILFLIGTSSIIAQQVTMPNIIGSNMVLQQNTHTPVWGWATAGTKVVIHASWGETDTIFSNANGKWMIYLKTPVALPGLAPVYTITVSGPTNVLMFTNILVGEVWLCSGQSNMWYNMDYYGSDMPGVLDYANEINVANYPNIRLFYVPVMNSTQVASDISSNWQVCSPTTVKKFSAVAYYFGKYLYNNFSVNVPIGLIESAYYGSGIQCWIKDSVLRSDAVLKAKYVDPVTSSTAVTSLPSQIYNSMLAPIIPFSIKGAIWYQGESNKWDATNYSKAILALVKDWRASWKSDFSFYAVQLAPRLVLSATPDTTSNYGFFCEFQGAISGLVKTGVTVNNDLLINPAERLTSHPRDKKGVGERLAKMALAKDYGVNIQCSGPRYQSYTIVGNSIRINFVPESLGGGLTTKDGVINLTEFRVSAANKSGFYPANAYIDGNSVIVTSPYVSLPAAVRFAFTEGAMPNLRNVDGIAAYPFRTDSWAQYPLIRMFDFNTYTLTSDNSINDINLAVYPNPCSDKLMISAPSNLVGRATLFDNLGRQVRSFPISENTEVITLNMSDVDKGVYLLMVNYSDRNRSFKIIKK